MRMNPPAELDRCRILDGEYGSEPGSMHGAFYVTEPRGRVMLVMSSGADSEYGWEHVSVSMRGRPPNWAEMCFVKNLFWTEDEVVVQYHPAKVNYVNNHPTCLHMWRPIDGVIRTPPSILVGTTGVEELSTLTPQEQAAVRYAKSLVEGKR